MKKRTMGFSDETIKKAAERNPFDQFVTNLASGASSLLAGGQDVISSIQNLSQQNQLNRIKKGDLGFSPEEAGKQAYKLSSGLEERKTADATRKQEQAIKKIEQKGLATPLADKSRIVNNLASGEIKKVKTLQSDLDSQGNQALDAYAKQLKEDGLGESEIQASLEEARKQVKQANSQLTAGEAQNTKQLLADTVGGNLEDVNKFKLQRRFNDLDSLQGKGDKTAANIGSIALETASRGVVQPLVNLGGELTSLAAGGADLLTGNRFKLGEKVGQQQQQYNQAFDNSLGKEQDLGTATQQFIGNSAPYLLTPETALGRNLTAQAMRGVRALPFASKGVQNVASKIIGASVKEGIQDTPLSLAQTAGDLTGAVQRGELTPEQALQQAPGAVGVNAIGDFVGAGVLRGAGDLAGQALKSGLPKMANALPGGESGAVGKLEPQPQLTVIEGGKSPVIQDLKTQLEETRSAIQDRLADVQGERALLSERSQNRLKKLENKEKELLVAIQKYEPSTKETTAKGLGAKQKAQQLADTINRRNPVQPPDQSLPPGLGNRTRIMDTVGNQGGNVAGQSDGLQKSLLQTEVQANKSGLDTSPEKLPKTEPLINQENLSPAKSSGELPKTEIGNPIIQETKPSQIKAAQKDLKNQYSDVLNKETAISEKPIRDGLEELGFEVKTNAKGEKYAQLGNVKVGLKDMPPPYSLSGLKSSLKERIASAKAAKDIQTGKVSDIEGVRSEFLDDAQASKYLDQLDGESLYQEKQFVDSIKNARSPQELEAIAAKRPDLFDYDEKGNPSKYLKEYEARETQLNNPTVKESSTVQTPQLGTKKVKNPDGTERIARTLGDYKAVDFQELKRQPEKLNKLSDIGKDISKVDEDAIDVISDLAKEKKIAENTLVDLSEALEKKLKDKGIDPNTYEYKGIQLFPGKGKDTPALNTRGQKVINRYERMLERLGLGERIETLNKDGTKKQNSLVVQTNLAKASNAKIGVQNSIDDLAEQIIKTRGDLPKITKQFQAAKDGFMAKTATKLENGGVDHVWSNRKADTAFHIARPKSDFVGKGESAAQIEDLRRQRVKQLEERQDTSRTVKGQYKTDLKDAETGKPVTVASKKFKSVYQELNEKLENKTAERMSTERDGEFANTVNKASAYVEKDILEGKVDEEIANEAADGFKKLDKQFSFSPTAIPVVSAVVKNIMEGNGLADTIELIYNVLPVGDKLDSIFKNAKLKTYKDAAFDLVMNTPKTIDQTILEVKTPRNEKFVAQMQKLEARKMLYEAKLADKNSEMFKEIQDLLEKKGVDEILDAEGNIRPEFENSKAADALAELADRKREMVELAEDYKDELMEKQGTIQRKIEKLEAQEQTPTVKRALNELKKEKFDLDKTIIAVDNKRGALQTIQGSGILQALQSAAYKGALFYNPSSAFLNLFDYANVRSAPELQTSKGLARLKNIIPFAGDVDEALYQVLGQKAGQLISKLPGQNLRANPDSLLNFFGADKRGSYYNVMSNASMARKAGKNFGDWMKSAWQKIEDFDGNKLIGDFNHDVVAVASARAWKADNPQYKNLPDPVTNYRAFEKVAPPEAKLSLTTKLAVDLGLVAGRGSKGADFALGGFANDPLGRSYLSFIKPVYRISNSLRRASTDLLDGINGFKKNDKGFYEFDFARTDKDKALKGLSSLIANVGGMYLVGGSAAVVGTPVIGSIMNFLVRDFVPEEQREEFKENFNQFSLANKKLLPGLGDRLQLQNRNLGEKDSVVGVIQQRFKSLGQPLLASYIDDIGEAMDMTYKLSAGEEVDLDKLKKQWLKLIPGGQLANKVNDFIGDVQFKESIQQKKLVTTDREKKIYNTDGFFPREIGTVKTKGDFGLFVGGGNEKIENLKQSDSLKARAKESVVKNVTFQGRPGELRPKFTQEGYAKFKSDVDRYMKLNPDENRNEVEKKLIEAARKKWVEKNPEMKKPTKPKRFKPVPVLIGDS